MNTTALPPLRATIPEAHEILRMSRGKLYQRIAAGEIALHKDGRRSYITTSELQRYVDRQQAAAA